MERKFKKIKIGYSIPNFDTAGSGKALLKIATKLDRNIFEPHIICMHSRGAFFKEVEKSGIPIHIIQYTTPMKPYIKGFLYSFKIAKQLKKIGLDIIHSFHYSADYSEPLASKIAGIKWIYTKKNMNWGGSSANSWKIRTFLANHVIYQNTDMKKNFFPKLKKTTLISRGVDINEFYPAEKNENLLNKHQINATDRLIVIVANLVPLKGVDLLIKAFQDSKVYLNDWKLLIVGDNNNKYGKELQQLVKEKELTSKIIFVGKVLNVKEYLNLAEIFVLPTIFKGEGSPVALLEAMATGLCVLGSNLPGIKDQLSKYENHLVEAGNLKKWTDTIEAYCNNTVEVNAKFGKQFLNQILNEYTLEKEVVKTEQVYLNVLK